MSAPDRIWHTIDRKGRIKGCPDAHVMPCADVQEAYTEYVRAYLCDPMQDERVKALVEAAGEIAFAAQSAFENDYENTRHIEGARQEYNERLEVLSAYYDALRDLEKRDT